MTVVGPYSKIQDPKTNMEDSKTMIWRKGGSWGGGGGWGRAGESMENKSLPHRKNKSDLFVLNFICTLTLRQFLQIIVIK